MFKKQKETNMKSTEKQIDESIESYETVLNEEEFNMVLVDKEIILQPGNFKYFNWQMQKEIKYNAEDELEFLEGVIKSRIESSIELEVCSKIEVYEEILEEIEEIKASRNVLSFEFTCECRHTFKKSHNKVIIF